MVQLFSLGTIILPNDEVVKKGKVFPATAGQAKQFDKLKSARPATAAEIKAAEEAAAIEDGTAYFPAPAPSDAVVMPVAVPDSGADKDPNSAPKGRST